MANIRKKHYLAQEVAELLQCKVSSVYELLRDGYIRGHKCRSGKWLIPKDQDYLNEHIMQGQSQSEEVAFVEETEKPAMECLSMSEMIVQIVKEHDGIKAKEIAKQLGINRTYVNSLLYNELKDSGCYNDGTGYWFFGKGQETNQKNLCIPEKSPAERARDIILNTAGNLLVLGKAGTGKSTFIRNITAELKKNYVILAPSGIAAIEVNGSTIHSFFRFDTLPYVPGTDPRLGRMNEDRLLAIQRLDTIIIDEISMVRADLLDRIDTSLQTIRHSDKPFGGVQVLMIGDIRQLPPVVEDNKDDELIFDNYDSEYFFDSRVFCSLDYQFIEFDKVYRQENGEFVELLNRVRDNKLSQVDLDIINARFKERAWENISDDKILLCTHNYQAISRNNRMMDCLLGPEREFKAVASNWYADSPAPWKLRLKIGAKVMFLKNKPQQNYYNGTLGKVTAMYPDYIDVKLVKTGEIISVKPETWYANDYIYNKETSTIELKERGTFTQYPLRPAWAITVHKSQGQTFDNVILNLGKCFADGQAYVAMSRCRSLEGITMMSRLKAEHIKTSDVVDDFLHELQTRKHI